MDKHRVIAAVGAYIFDSQNRVFLGKFASKFQKRWSTPGGKVDFGESPLQAVLREIKEETNIDISAPEYFSHGAFIANNTHLHAKVKGPPDNSRLLNFRNSLREKPELVKDYATLKNKLWQRGAARQEYTRGKGDFVGQVLSTFVKS